MKYKSKFGVEYFIRKFSALRPSLWTTGTLRRVVSKTHTQHCALGHCKLKESSALLSIFRKFGLSVSRINDDRSETNPQKTPRGRILTALRWIRSQEKK